mgnify:CR=1 FL=1
MATDVINTGTEWLNQMRAAHSAQSVEFRRGGETHEVLATIGRTTYEVADDYGTRLDAHAMDFLILADDLGFEPQAGDVIVFGGRKYEVMNLAPDGVWRWSDPYRTTFRIHTKDVGAVT